MSALLDVSDLRVYFHTRHGVVKAVDGVEFKIQKGEVLGIVGESGSGKSVTCLGLLGLLPAPPAKIESGRAYFHGEELLGMDAESRRKIRGKKISMIFQEPMTSLNPYLRIHTQMAEILTTHEGAAKEEARERSIAMLDRVGIPEPRLRIDCHPHEFSGGMRQRVMIAMALLTRPDILIADEPTTALDVTIQAQILELIRELKTEFGMSVILISHAMGVVAEMSDQLLVMYAGRVVERGGPAEIFKKPAHPYTQGLLESMPKPATEYVRRADLKAIPGNPPDLARLPGGCVFAPRCAHVQPVCREVYPDERSRPGESTHRFRCHVDI